MYYSIERLLSILPPLSWAIVLLTFLILEVKNYTESLREEPEQERSGFTPPPGTGYEYYVQSGTIVYLLQKARNRFRVYVIQGETPNVPCRRDRFGRFFTISCGDNATAERMIDRAYQR